ncbi:TetR/AcrR family transcriptional regulator [Leifsonia poae]|uniref:TetR/AcrR family transcriptional regulator n=1 Tax=Leifsonia poae TaxID=110933 RepID=UPI003D68EECF
MDAAPVVRRRDASRNRALVIDAAREVFAAHGLAAPLDRVAARAGVSRATLYRNFSDRESLWEAVVTDPLVDILKLAERAAKISSASEALVVYLVGVGEREAGPDGFVGIMTTRFRPGSSLAVLRERVQSQVDELVRRAVEEGRVRPDLAETDLALVSIALASMIERTRDIAPDAWRRLLRLLLEGVLTASADAVSDQHLLAVPPIRRNEVWRAFSR